MIADVVRHRCARRIRVGLGQHDGSNGRINQCSTAQSGTEGNYMMGSRARGLGDVDVHKIHRAVSMRLDGLPKDLLA